MCCPGCKAVAELILASGMQNYYALRDAPIPGASRPEATSAEWQAFDRDDMLAAFAESEGEHSAVTIYVAGMYCSACSWLIETSLSRMRGVHRVDINPFAHRVRVQFDPGTLTFGALLATLSDLGYKPQPLMPDTETRPELLEQRMALKRLLVASLGMMQVMMFAVALYAGEFQGIDDSMQHFFRLVSLLVTTPVVFYSGRPFFAAALRGLRARQPGMDLPVAIAIGGAYIASVYATLNNGAAVWFDSVTMFIFFLTVGRFLEMRARHRSVERSIALSSILPDTVTRIEDGEHETVSLGELCAGDHVLVRQGDSFPADGTLLNGPISVDEALLSGESRPLGKRAGDSVIAGSINLDGLAEMRVHATGVDTTLGTISRLSEKARYARPTFVQVADRIASVIVIAILFVAAAVAVVWSQIDASRAFVVTLSVLVVTCPCALALATPAAFAAAGSRLADLRLLLTNGNAIEPLAKASRIIFDKTGTLTLGRPEIVATTRLNRNWTESQCLAIAAALEFASSHPIAAAFAGYAGASAENLEIFIGEGVRGQIDGREWRLGKASFAGQPVSEDDASVAGIQVWLANDEGVVARFDLDDALRPDAIETLQGLRKLGISVEILSGDRETAVRRVADRLGIRNYRHSISPDNKLAHIREAQQTDIVVMVGDGINDAPVLAGADASITPASAARLAQTGADLIMLGDSLAPVFTAIRLARKTMRIVRQNLLWAIIYNAAALPLAAFGLVPPWLAAIGMSASSLIVVLNALRLSRS